MAWLNGNHGDSKVEIKPQVDQYTIDGKEFLVLAEGTFSKLRMCNRTPKFCNE